MSGKKICFYWPSKLWMAVIRSTILPKCWLNNFLKKRVKTKITTTICKVFQNIFLTCSLSQMVDIVQAEASWPGAEIRHFDKLSDLTFYRSKLETLMNYDISLFFRGHTYQSWSNSQSQLRLFLYLAFWKSVLICVLVSDFGFSCGPEGSN